MKRVIFLLCIALTLTTCDKNDNVVLLFSVQDDLDLGAQVSKEIENDPQYDILPRTQYPEAYSYLDSIVDAILNSGEVAYRDEFEWDVHILHDDETLNAFATPGGFIYVYTGLIKYLNSADALAGVLGHEIAHADLRHTSRNLQKTYGIQILLSLLVGENASTLETIAAQIAGTAAGLKFSRDYETEADEKSVVYLAKTGFACDGAKIFFEQLEASGQTGGTPEFLSTHPSPDNRIENIEKTAAEEDCNTTPSGGSGYAQFKADLP